MGQALIEAVPNFSEGSDASVIDYIAGALLECPGAYLLDRTSDEDHNRTVLTIAGEPEAVWSTSIAMVARASERIDLRRHKGVHPRMGACDVLPFVPIDASLDDCVTLARRAGAEIWRRLRIPVFFYEAAAGSPDRVRLENVRRGGFEAPRELPDIGGPALHPTAGATIVGARKFLIAYNVNLDTPDVTIARRIAERIRASSGGLPHVKAMGLFLRSRGIAQVSMNLTDFEITSVDEAFAAVLAESELLGVGVLSSELIGLIPRRALPATDVRWENFDPGKILENRLDAAIHSK